jgi:hypothetical protein
MTAEEMEQARQEMEAMEPSSSPPSSSAWDAR